MKLSRRQLEALTDAERQAVLEEMSIELTSRILSALDFDSEVENIIGELRGLGHDLYSFDASDEWQVWMGDWTIPEQASDKLMLHLHQVEGVEVSWSKPQASRDDAS